MRDLDVGAVLAGIWVRQSCVAGSVLPVFTPPGPHLSVFLGMFISRVVTLRVTLPHCPLPNFRVHCNVKFCHEHSRIIIYQMTHSGTRGHCSGHLLQKHQRNPRSVDLNISGTLTWSLSHRTWSRLSRVPRSPSCLHTAYRREIHFHPSTVRHRITLQNTEPSLLTFPSTAVRCSEASDCHTAEICYELQELSSNWKLDLNIAFIGF